MFMLSFLLKTKKATSFFLVLAFVFVTSFAQYAKAETITTERMLAVEASNETRQEMLSFLSRKDVVTELESHGVSYLEARERINAMTDEELQTFSKNVGKLPIGGHGVGTVVGAVVLIFVILLITDILGLTKVFPFTRSVR